MQENVPEKVIATETAIAPSGSGNGSGWNWGERTRQVNVSRKYGISCDDLQASWERLVKYILDTYNFGSEMVVIAFLDLIRNGDLPPERETAEERQGIYRR